MTNTERQRRFREAHPGYYRKYYRSMRSHAKAARAAALMQQLAAAEAAATRPPLLLPAPVETVVIPGLNAVAATSTTRVPLPVAA